MALIPALAQATAASGQAAGQSRGSVSGLARELRQTVDRLQFQQVLDTTPPGTAQFRALDLRADKDATTPQQRARMHAANTDPKPIVQQPQIDATVLELDRSGRPVRSGTVLMSPQYTHGIAVPVDRNFHTTAVRWRQWDDSGWYTDKGKGTIDIVPGRERAPIDFMSPYPASVLKLMVNFGVLRLVDKGEVKLDGTFQYVNGDSTANPPVPPSALCGANSTNTIRNYMDLSLTISDNGASCALIKLLWQHNAVASLNQTFQDLGLETLQLKGTNPATGGHWSNPVTMDSLDTAKLLAVVNGGRGRLWTAPNGKPVTGGVLSPSSRQFFKQELGQQGYNDMLSTSNFCGAPYPAPGIPQVVPQRWIQPDGTALVDGNNFGRDVRPCNSSAQVTYAHKTGLVNNSAGDAGIVRSLPGKAGRSYIIVVFSNLGDEYIDSNRPSTPPGLYAPTYTEKFAKLGRAMDRYETDWFRAH